MQDNTASKNESSDADHKLEKSVYVILGVVSAVLILIGVQMHHEGGDHPTYFWSLGSTFVSELGIAGFIALLLISTIEKFTRARHQRSTDQLLEQIKKDLFKAIYSRHVPPSVFSEVERSLLNSDLFRSHYDVRYAFRTIDPEMAKNAQITEADRDSHLCVYVTSRYEMHNMSDEEVLAPIEFLLEKPIDVAMRKMLNVVKLRIGENEIVGGELEKLKADEPARMGIKTKEKIPGNGSVSICIEARTVKRKTDMEVWASRIPSDGIRLEVIAPESIEVEAVANHSSELSHSQIGDGNTHVWELRKGIFPHQSVIFWWNAK